MNKDGFSIKAKSTQNKFIETTKKMISKSGASSASIQKIADIVGCPLETLYNYFKSLDELLWHTRNAMVEDLLGKMFENRHEFEKLTDMKHLYKDYIDFCIANPNYYRFFFFYHLKKSSVDFLHKVTIELAKKFSETYYKLHDSCDMGFEKIIHINNALLYAVHGLLTIYISGNFDFTRDDVYAGLDSVANTILSNR